MIKSLTFLAGLLISTCVYAQINVDGKEASHRVFYAGVEWFSALRTATGIKTQFIYQPSKKDQITLYPTYMLAQVDNEYQRLGWDAILLYRRLINNEFYIGIGGKYTNTEYEGWLIMNKINFFEELDFSQMRRFVGGVFTFGGIFNMDPFYLDVSPKIFYGSEYTEGIEGLDPTAIVENRTYSIHTRHVAEDDYRPFIFYQLDVSLLYAF